MKAQNLTPNPQPDFSSTTSMGASDDEIATQLAIQFHFHLKQEGQRLAYAAAESQLRQKQRDQAYRDRDVRYRTRSFRNTPNAIGIHEQRDRYLAAARHFADAGLRDGERERALKVERDYHEPGAGHEAPTDATGAAIDFIRA